MRQPVGVRTDAGRDIGEAVVATGGAQPGQVGLREALVLALECLGEVDVLDQSLAHQFGERQRFGVASQRAGRVHGGHGNVVERLRTPGAQVEHTALAGALQEPQVDGDHVAHEHEVARLFAGAIAAVGAEELDLAGVAELVEVMERDRGHAAFVLLARAVDVEVAEPCDLRVRGGQHAPHHIVEQQLRVAIDVQRSLEFRRFAERRATAIGGRRRRVQQPRAAQLAGVEQVLRAPVIGVEHEAAVVLHRVGAGALVQHRLDAAELAFREARVELGAVEVVAQPGAQQVAVLRAVGQVIDANHVVDADRIQPVHEVAADHAGRAGDDDFHGAAFMSNSSAGVLHAKRFTRTVRRSRRWPCRTCRPRCRRPGSPAASLRAGSCRRPASRPAWR